MNEALSLKATRTKTKKGNEGRLQPNRNGFNLLISYPENKTAWFQDNSAAG